MYMPSNIEIEQNLKNLQLKKQLLDNNKRHRGKCKWFDNKKGYGFIEMLDGTGDVFVHQSQLYCIGWRTLQKGEYVEFFIETQVNNRRKAINVTGPGGRPCIGIPQYDPYTNNMLLTNSNPTNKQISTRLFNNHFNTCDYHYNYTQYPERTDYTSYNTNPYAQDSYKVPQTTYSFHTQCNNLNCVQSTIQDLDVRITKSDVDNLSSNSRSVDKIETMQSVSVTFADLGSACTITIADRLWNYNDNRIKDVKNLISQRVKLRFQKSKKDKILECLSAIYKNVPFEILSIISGFTYEMNAMKCDLCISLEWRTVFEFSDLIAYEKKLLCKHCLDGELLSGHDSSSMIIGYY